MSALADTNVVLAFLLVDRQEERAAAAAWIDEHGPLTVTEVVLAETCWYLVRTLGTPRQIAIGHLRALLASDGFGPWDEHLALEALRLMESDPQLSVADCILAARAQLDGDVVLTFDRRLARAIDKR